MVWGFAFCLLGLFFTFLLPCWWNSHFHSMRERDYYPDLESRLLNHMNFLSKNHFSASNLILKKNCKINSAETHKCKNNILLFKFYRIMQYNKLIWIKTLSQSYWDRLKNIENFSAVLNDWKWSNLWSYRFQDWTSTNFGHVPAELKYPWQKIRNRTFWHWKWIFLLKLTALNRQNIILIF